MQLLASFVRCQKILMEANTRVYLANILFPSLGENGKRPCCDFVAYTTKGLSISRIQFDDEF